LENNWFFKKMSQKKTIAITGITGFVGQNLSAYLSDAYRVRGISRQPSASNLSYADFFEGTHAYDVLIHLAGKAHDLKKTSKDSEYYEVNFELTKRLYDQFLQSNATTFIYVSSVKAVADTVDGVLIEDVVSNPITVYGKSKQMAEDYILNNLPANKKVYILRPCMIHGPGNKGNLNLLFALVSKGIPYPLGIYENKRSFLSVENLCYAITILLKKDIDSAVFNLADDVALSTNEVITLVSESLGRKAKIIAFPKSIVAVVARIGDFLPLPINTEKLQKLTENYEVSNAKIKSQLALVFPLSSRDGLIKTFKSFQK
jgi:nucleoside-diphosphate-sugar epimerase